MLGFYMKIRLHIPHYCIFSVVSFPFLHNLNRDLFKEPLQNIYYVLQWLIDSSV